MAAFSSSLTTALASPRGRGRGDGAREEEDEEEDTGSTYIKSKIRNDANRQTIRRSEAASGRARWRFQASN